MKDKNKSADMKKLQIEIKGINNCRKFKVCLLGASLDTGNMGVSALCTSLVKIILQIRPNSDIALFIGNRSSQPQNVHLAERSVKVQVLNFRLSPKAALKQNLIYIFFLACFQRLIPISYLRESIISSNSLLKAMDEADFVGEINGGDSFSDIYGLNRFFFNILPSIITLLIRKELVLLPQTFGPYNSFVARMIAKLVINGASRIFTRDMEGLQILNRLFLKTSSKKHVAFCPDVAFLLDSIVPKEIEVNPIIDWGKTSPIIGLNINGLMYNGGYTLNNMFRLKFDYRQFIVKLVAEIMQKTNSRLLLIPHTYGQNGGVNSDPDACHEVFNSSFLSYTDRIYLVTKRYDQSEIKGIINKCDFFIGSRMHACIAAISQGVPTVGVAYSGKFKGVFDSIDIGDMVIDARNIDMNSAIKKILSHYENRNKMIAYQKEKVFLAQDLIKKTFLDLLH